MLLWCTFGYRCYIPEEKAMCGDNWNKMHLYKILCSDKIIPHPLIYLCRYDHFNTLILKTATDKKELIQLGWTYFKITI